MSELPEPSSARLAFGDRAESIAAVDDPILALGFLEGEHLDPSGPLTPTGHLRRRQLISRLSEVGQTASAVLALAVLSIVVYSVVEHGAGLLNIGFLTKGPPVSQELPGGGIAPEIVGTALLIGVATVIAMPLGVLVALYLTEFAPDTRSARVIGLALDLLNGLPTIIVGLFIFGLFVVGGGQSGFAGSLALAIIMLPLIARAAQEVLRLVPNSMREAADALGISRWRAVRGVVLPSALGGILTGTVLAIARAAGETAPLILVSSVFGNSVTLRMFGQALPNIPVYIYTASEGASAYGFERAWGAAFVLLMFIFFTNLGGRALLGRSRAKLMG
ncbi:MAG TPA: phosphate ABC transporter permease PstA [Solirubrobacteraceae bacterium]|jgi:phosphate transport system permease protein